MSDNFVLFMFVPEVECVFTCEICFPCADFLEFACNMLDFEELITAAL